MPGGMSIRVFFVYPLWRLFTRLTQWSWMQSLGSFDCCSLYPNSNRSRGRQHHSLAYNYDHLPSVRHNWRRSLSKRSTQRGKDISMEHIDPNSRRSSYCMEQEYHLKRLHCTDRCNRHSQSQHKRHSWGHRRTQCRLNPYLSSRQSKGVELREAANSSSSVRADLWVAVSISSESNCSLSFIFTALCSTTK